VLAVYMTQKFDFEFEDPENNTKMPMAHIDMSEVRPIWLKLTAAKK